MCGGADTLTWRAARIRSGGGVPRVALSAPLPLDTWTADRSRPSGLRRDPAGEYLGVTLLRDGSIGVATPIQTPTRMGFTWWRLR